MDQPTNFEITITGKTEDVKRAALASQRRIDLGTEGFEESAYAFGDGSDFKDKMDEAIEVLGSYEFMEQDDGTAEYSTEQESYACEEENDIKAIANDIIKASPNVEFKIEAVITATYAEGYELSVFAEYVDGQLTVDTSEEYFDDEDEEDDEDDEDE